MRETGIPYVVWPESIISNKDLIRTVKAYKGEVDDLEKEQVKKSNDIGFREKHKATIDIWERDLLL